MDKKILIAIIVLLATLGGILLTGREDPARANIVLWGQILVIIVSVWIGLSAVEYFTRESIFGKAVAFLSYGLIAWAIGNFVWWYYVTFAGDNIPYPSLADVGYILTIPFAAYGLYLLVKNIDFSFDKKTIAKIIILPLIVLIATYFLFIQGTLAGDAGLLEKALNVAYPVGDIIFLSFALVILSVTWGGAMFWPFAVLSLGFIFQAIADFTFSYTTATETWYSGGASDIFFILAFFTIGIGIYYLEYSNRKVTAASTPSVQVATTPSATTMQQAPVTPEASTVTVPVAKPKSGPKVAKKKPVKKSTKKVSKPIKRKK